MAALRRLQREIDLRLRHGEPFSQIEDDLIEGSDLSQEGKSALWLYGWSRLERGRRRYERNQDEIRRRARSSAIVGSD